MEYRLITWRYGYKEYLTENGAALTTQRSAAWVVSEETANLFPEYWRETVEKVERSEKLGLDSLKEAW